MRATCPTEMDESLDIDYERLKKDCERYEPIEDPYSAIPVTSNRTKTTYQNIYCAACNGENSADLHFWEPKIWCSRHVQRQTNATTTRELYNLLKQSQWNERQRRWMLPMYGSKASCSLRLKEPGVKGIRHCRPAVDECLASWPQDVTRAYCDAYTGYVYKIRKRPIFKNVHCMLCNNENSEDYSCKISWNFQSYREGPMTFAIIMDVNYESGGSSSVGQSTLCDPGFLHDPYTESCRLVACSRMFTEVDGTCMPKVTTAALPIVNSSDLNTTYNFSQPNNTILIGCKVIKLDKEEYLLPGNGSLFVYSHDRLYDQGEYEILEDGSVWICAPNQNQTLFFKFDAVQGWLSFIGQVISLVCLTLHMAVYVVFPQLRNTPGKILMSLVFAIFLGQLLFVVGVDRVELQEFCTMVAILMHYSFLASFFWMNVMAYDIHKTFGSTKLKIGQKGNQLLAYTIYAWATPLLVIITATLVDYFAPESEFKPNYGDGLCWITSRPALIIFFAGPVGVIVVVNLVFFILTARNMRATQKATQFARTKDSESQRFAFYVKLAVIMGMTWIFGYIATFADVSQLWYVFIVFNTLQGAFIFFSFTCTRNVLKLSKEKLGIEKKKPKRPEGTTITNKTSTTSLMTRGISLEAQHVYAAHHGNA